MNRATSPGYHRPVMHPARLRCVLAAAAAIIASACQPTFRPQSYGSNAALYKASLAEFQHQHWDNAVTGFEKLSMDLPARDTLMPAVYWYLGKAHDKRNEHLLAAQSFTRLAETFPDDSLADDALLAAGYAYAKMWRKPELDETYGETAESTLRTMLALYPNSTLRDDAQREIAHLEEWFATKIYKTADHYMRRHAYDSAIIYLKDVVSKYPDTKTAREAYLRLVEAYRSIDYKADAAEACNAARQQYPNDREVRELCGPATSSASATPPSR